MLPPAYIPGLCGILLCIRTVYGSHRAICSFCPKHPGAFFSGCGWSFPNPNITYPYALNRSCPGHIFLMRFFFPPRVFFASCIIDRPQNLVLCTFRNTSLTTDLMGSSRDSAGGSLFRFTGDTTTTYQHLYYNDGDIGTPPPCCVVIFGVQPVLRVQNDLTCLLYEFK